jgi:hypothetical protein
MVPPPSQDFVGSAHRTAWTREPLPTGRQAQRDSPTFLNGLRTRITDTPACPAYAEAASRRQAKRQHFGVQALNLAWYRAGTDTFFQNSLLRIWPSRSLKSSSISRILIFPTNLLSLIKIRLP